MSKAKNRYEVGSDYHKIAQIGASTVHASRKALASKAARILRKSVKVVRFSVDVVCNPKQRSNRGKTEAVKVNGGIRVKYMPVQEAAKASA